MNRRERVQAAVKKQEVDRIPMGFWLHFPKEYHHGMPSVDMHLKFFTETRTDICKIMNENIFPCNHNIFQAPDWNNIKVCSRNSNFIQDQIEITKRIVDSINGDAVVLATIHGVVASASHALLGEPKYDRIGRYAQIYHLRTNPESIFSAYNAIAETLAILTEESIKAGVDGIYYAALGGESDGFTDEEHARYIAPADKIVLDAAQGAKGFNVLHMCKPLVDLHRFVNYSCDVVNWGITESGVTLAEGMKIFPGKTVMGGLDDRSPALLEGTYEDIEKEIHSIIDTVGMKGFILASDCTLPSDLELRKIRLIADACESYRANSNCK